MPIPVGDLFRHTFTAPDGTTIDVAPIDLDPSGQGLVYSAFGSDGLPEVWNNAMAAPTAADSNTTIKEGEWELALPVPEEYDVYTEIVMAGTGNTRVPGWLIAGESADGHSCYYVRLRAGGTATEIVSLSSGGGFTSLVSEPTTWTSGDRYRVRIRVDATSITVFRENLTNPAPEEQVATAANTNWRGRYFGYRHSFAYSIDIGAQGEILDNFYVDSVGGGLPPVEGDLLVTEPSDTFSGTASSGPVPITGDLLVTESPDTFSGTATADPIPISGDLLVTEPPDTFAGLGNLGDAGVVTGRIWTGVEWVQVGVEEAPIDGQEYVRISGEWQVSSLSGGYWSPSGDDIFNNNVGNVGIGTSNPTDTLHVFGDGMYGQASTGGAGNGFQMRFGASQGFFSEIQGSLVSGTANTRGDLFIRTRRGVNDADLSDTAKFGSDGGITFPELGDAGGTKMVTVDPDGLLLTQDIPGSALWTQTGDNISNTNTGSVGIGLTSPAEALHINKTRAVIRLQATGLRQWAVGVPGITSFTIRDETAAENRMIINSSGQVTFGNLATAAGVKMVTCNAQGLLAFQDIPSGGTGDSLWSGTLAGDIQNANTGSVGIGGASEGGTTALDVHGRVMVRSLPVSTSFDSFVVHDGFGRLHSRNNPLPVQDSGVVTLRFYSNVIQADTLSGTYERIGNVVTFSASGTVNFAVTPITAVSVESADFTVDGGNILGHKDASVAFSTSFHSNNQGIITPEISASGTWRFSGTVRVS
mgnify:CR=1 FL=1